MNTDRSQLIQDFFANVSAMRRAMASQMRLEGKEQLPPSQGELLLIVTHEQPISLKCLAQAMRLTPGAISQLVESLERVGYVRREPSSEDRRVINVVTTEMGNRKITAFKRQHGDFMKQMTGALTDHELATMIAIQRKMIASLQQLHTDDSKKEVTTRRK